MDNYTVHHVESTASAGSIIISAGIILASVLLAPSLPHVPHSPHMSSLISYPRASITESSKTYGQYENAFTREYEVPEISFEETIMSFYEQLLKAQEPLGEEFEQVLHDNLWNLLVRT